MNRIIKRDKPNNNCCKICLNGVIFCAIERLRATDIIIRITKIKFIDNKTRK